jgi:hypothetical protein
MWPAFWAFGQYFSGGTFYTEIDFWETFAKNYGYPTNQWSASTHSWGPNGQTSGGGGGVTNSAQDAEFHLYAWLWEPASTINGNGKATFFKDNALVAIYNYPNPARTGPGGNAGLDYLENGQKLFMKLGGAYSSGGPSATAGGGTANLIFDWIRVCQRPG